MFRGFLFVIVFLFFPFSFHVDRESKKVMKVFVSGSWDARVHGQWTPQASFVLACPSTRRSFSLLLCSVFSFRFYLLSFNLFLSMNISPSLLLFCTPVHRVFSLSLSLSLIVFSLLRSGIATRCTDPKRGTHVPWSSFVRLWETMVTDRLPMLSRPWTRSFDSIFDDQVTSCAVKPANLPSSPSATLKFLVLASWLVVSILSNQTCFHSVRDGWQVSTVLSLDIYIYDDTFFFTSSFLFLRSPRFSPIRDAWSRNRFVRWSCWPRTLCAINELARIRGS